MNIAKSILAFFLDIIETVVVALCIFVIVYLVLAQPHQVIGNSMFPNFHDKEYILTDKISYRFREPQRGEIVVFKSPEDEEKDFIKRIIALPGEKVRLGDGKVYVNGVALSEIYLDPNLRTPAGRFLTEGHEITVEPGKFIVMGDNRLNSSDSRTWGFITKDEIIGRAMLVYWPPPEFRLVPEVEYR